MKELDKSKIYDLSELRSEELKKIFEYLKNTHNWDNVIFENWSEFSNLKENVLLCESYGWIMKYNHYKPCRITNAKELFYTLENIQDDCRGLTEEQIKKMCDIYEDKGYYLSIHAKENDEEAYILSYNNITQDGEYGFYKYDKEENNENTIKYEKFMELFGNKEKSEEFKNLVDDNSGCRDLIGERIKEMVHPCVKNDYKVVNSNLEINKAFKDLVEVLNEELTEEACKETEYEVKYIAEKPKQYQAHYNNENGSLYKIATDLGLNHWEFDVFKRLVRCRKKNQFKEDLQKIKDTIDIYLNEYSE